MLSNYGLSHKQLIRDFFAKTKFIIIPGKTIISM